MKKIVVTFLFIQMFGFKVWSKIDDESLEKVTKIINSFAGVEGSCTVSARPLENQEVEVTYFDSQQNKTESFQIGKQFYLMALPGKNKDFYIKLNTPSGYINQKKILIHLVTRGSQFIVDKISIARNLKSSNSKEVFNCPAKIVKQNKLAGENKSSPSIDSSELIGEFLIGAAESYIEAQGRNPLAAASRGGLVAMVPSLVISVYKQVKSDLQEDMKKCKDRGLKGDRCYEFLLDPFAEAKEKLNATSRPDPSYSNR